MKHFWGWMTILYLTIVLSNTIVEGFMGAPTAVLGAMLSVLLWVKDLELDKERAFGDATAKVLMDWHINGRKKAK